MRLVRVTTEDQQSVFDAQFNADNMNVKEGAKMALQSLTLEQRDSLININPSNNEVSYFVDGVEYRATLDNDTYSTEDSNDLLINMTEELNDTAQYYVPGTGQQETLQGLEYKVSIDTEHRVQIHARKGEIGEIDSNEWAASPDISIGDNGTSDTWGVDNASVLGANQCRVAFLHDRMPSGNGFEDVLINKAVWNAAKTGATNAVWLCCATEDVSNLTPAQLQALIQDPVSRLSWCEFGVGIQIENAAGANGGNLVRYLKIEDGVASTLATSTNGIVTDSIENPRIRLQRSGNSMYASYYCIRDAQEDAVRLNGNVLSKSTWQFLVLWDNEDSLELAQVQGSRSPFSNVILTQPLEQFNADIAVHAPGDIITKYWQPRGFDIVYSPYAPDYFDTNNYFQFSSLDLAQFLGFDSVRLPRSGSVQSINFVATAPAAFSPRVIADSIIVLSDTFQLDSFDSYHPENQAGLGQRQSILAVVPVDKSNDGKLAYEARNLIWVDIRNRGEEWLRSLRFRLVNGTYSPIELYGLASLVLLVKEFDE